MEQRKLNITKKNSRSFLAKWVIIPVALVIVWVILSVHQVQKSTELTVLIHNHSKNEIISGKTGELLAGQKIKGEFVARENNLGIVAVRFNTFFRINHDVVHFRIREKGSNQWLVENSYTTPQFQPNQYFTFGFPIIENSEGRRYVFEVESEKGKPNNAVALSPIEPIYVTKYQYLKEKILSDNGYLATFLQRKIVNTFTNLDFLISFVAFSLPLLVYLIRIIFFDKYLADKYYIVLLPIVIMLLLSITNNTRNDGAVLGFSIFWIYLSFIYKLEGAYSYLIALLLFILSSFLYYFRLDQLSTNLAMWTLMLLFSGTILQILEIILGQDKLIGISKLVSSVRFRYRNIR